MITLKQYLKPKTIVSESEQWYDLPLQIDLSLIKSFKKYSVNLKHYYVYLIFLTYARNRIAKYKKLSKHDRKQIRKQNLHPKYNDGKFFNIHVEDVFKFASNFIAKHRFKSYYEEVYYSNEFEIYFEEEDEGILTVYSPNHLDIPNDLIEEGYDIDKRLEISIPFQKNFSYPKFINILVRALAEMPLLSISKKELPEHIDADDIKSSRIKLNSQLSEDEIARIAHISCGRVSQILKHHKKYYIIQKVTENEYHARRNKNIPCFSIVTPDNETEYYIFLNSITTTKSNFNYRFNYKFEDSTKKTRSIKPLSKTSFFSRVFASDTVIPILSNRARFENRNDDSSIDELNKESSSTIVYGILASSHVQATLMHKTKLYLKSFPKKIVKHIKSFQELKSLICDLLIKSQTKSIAIQFFSELKKIFLALVKYTFEKEERLTVLNYILAR